MNESRPWTMSVDVPRTFQPRDVLAVCAFCVGGQLVEFQGAAAWRFGDAIVLAEYDDDAHLVGLFPLVLTIYNADLVAAGALAEHVAQKLHDSGGWRSDPDPAAFVMDHHPDWS